MNQSYKEKYEQALEKATIYHKQGNEDMKLMMETCFPELKENKEKKVKRILHSISSKMSFHLHDIFTEEEFQCFDAWSHAWLEKQGEQKEDARWEVLEKLLEADSIYQMAMNDAMIAEAKSKAISAISELCIFDLLGFEKKGEQKPSDTVEQKPVEQKFRVSDWVVLSTSDGEKVVQIDSIEYFKSGEPRYITSEGRWFGNGTKAHLWTIKDAKDGDVLVDSYSKDSIIILYKGIYKERSILAHCGWNGYNLSIKTNGLGYGGLDNTNYSPATKEQRDILFEEMQKKGYEWDAEKKKLKKVEPFDKYEGLTDFERTLADICIGWIGEEPGWKQYIKDNANILLKIAIKKFNSIQDVPFEQKPAWSEKDIIHLNKCISYMSRLDSSEMDWLKSLKKRIEEQ